MCSKHDAAKQHSNFICLHQVTEKTPTVTPQLLVEAADLSSMLLFWMQELGWKRSDIVVSTKVFWGGDGPNDTGLSRKHIVEGTRVRGGGLACVGHHES